MKKILWILILLITVYGVTLFMKPSITDGIEKTLGFSGFGEKIRTNFGFVNEAVTDIPNLGEIQSGALDIKNKISDGIQTTKETIDTIRSTAGEAEETYNKAKDVYNETTDTINKLKGTLNDVEKLGDSIKSTVNTNIVQ